LDSSSLAHPDASDIISAANQPMWSELLAAQPLPGRRPGCGYGYVVNYMAMGQKPGT
jgi:hypothetical protein